MGELTLGDILMTPLSSFATEGGDVLHAMKATDIGFEGFGEAYFSCINFGSIKAWKRHSEMWMNLVVPAGQVRFVFCLEDSSSTAAFRIIEIGEGNYARITVPPGIWFGFQGLSDRRNLVLNISDTSYSPQEVERRELNEISFDWVLPL
jgi:dTDP-4-dehydrorhamnose 3,5-epimerase